MKPRAPKLSRLFAIIVVLVGACGGGDDGSGRADLVVRGFESQDYDRDAYQVTAGDVTIEYVNEARDEHSVVIEGRNDLRLVAVGNGVTDRGTVTLDPGEYLLFCDIPGHRANGMVARLEVLPAVGGD